MSWTIQSASANQAVQRGSLIAVTGSRIFCPQTSLQRFSNDRRKCSKVYLPRNQVRGWTGS